jgi:hypothetical protein
MAVPPTIKTAQKIVESRYCSLVTGEPCGKMDLGAVFQTRVIVENMARTEASRPLGSGLVDDEDLPDAIDGLPAPSCGFDVKLVSRVKNKEYGWNWIKHYTLDTPWSPVVDAGGSVTTTLVRKYGETRYATRVSPTPKPGWPVVWYPRQKLFQSRVITETTTRVEMTRAAGSDYCPSPPSPEEGLPVPSAGFEVSGRIGDLEVGSSYVVAYSATAWSPQPTNGAAWEDVE